MRLLVLIALTAIFFILNPALPADDGLQILSLEECLEIALEKNHFTPASRYAVEAAEAMHKQALSSYSPRLGLRAQYQLFDEDPNFIFPEQAIDQSDLAVPIATAQTYKTLIDMGLTPTNAAWDATWTATYPAVATATTTALQNSKTPEYDIKLLDRSNKIAMLDLMWPVYTGGYRGALIRQAEAGIEAAKQELKRSSLKVMHDVKRYYYSSILARRLVKIGNDTLSRMKATLELTESLYKTGSGTVKKTDYLRNKVMVESLKSMVHRLEHNQVMARSALAGSMGLSWNSEVEPSDSEIAYLPCDFELPDLVNMTFRFNPDWKTIQAGLNAAKAKVDEERSGFSPKLAITGTVTGVFNSYDKGAVSSDNRRSWVIGAGMEIPIYNGHLTRNKIREAQALLNKLSQQELLLKEGLGLQVKEIFTRMICFQKQQESNKAARDSSRENRELNVRAYQHELVETADVITAQLAEAFMDAQYEMVLFNHVSARLELEHKIGEEVKNMTEL